MNIVFDIGNVLVRWDARAAFAALDAAADAFLSGAGIMPSTCVFIDDCERNVAGARGFGMDGIHFTTPEVLETALTERGLL